MKSVSAVLLAAGLGLRAKTFKPHLTWKGETFISKVYRSLVEANCFQEILIVTGHRSELLSDWLNEANAKHIFNSQFNTGMLSSIQCGLKALWSNWDGALIAHVDQPHLDATEYAYLVHKFQNSRASLVRPCYRGGSLGNPTIIGRTYLYEVLKRPPDDLGCKFLFEKRSKDMLFVRLKTDACLRDFNFSVSAFDVIKPLIRYG